MTSSATVVRANWPRIAENSRNGHLVAAAPPELPRADQHAPRVELTIEREPLWERLTADDLRALTPLFHGHINPYGQFALALARPSFLEAA